jgi:membrane associated rhomboid family serine protease
MRDAAVGFQCKNCIADGAKQTRSGRTAYGGQRSANPHLTSSVLIGINLAVWLLIIATGWQQSEWIYRLGLVPDWTIGWDPSGESGVIVNGVARGSWWQLGTVMFTHVEAWHIGFNMLALWQLGPMLENAIGRTRFLALYFLSGFAASALIYVGASPQGVTVGASGALFGLMAALLVMAIKVNGNVQQILGWIGVNFVITFVFVNYISWQGHVGGFLGGLAIGGAIIYAPKQRRTVYQLAAMGLVAAFVVIAIVLRTIALSDAPALPGM